MSVRKSERKVSKLEYVQDAQVLCAHTFKMCANKKHFPENRRKIPKEKRRLKKLRERYLDTRSSVTSFLANAKRGNTWRIQQEMRHFYRRLTGGELP